MRREIAALVAAGPWTAHLMYDPEDYPALKQQDCIATPDLDLQGPGWTIAVWC